MATLSAQARRSRYVIAAGFPAAVLLALSVGGCRATDNAAASNTTASTDASTSSIASLSAAQIRDAAAINLAMASSVHVRGYITTTSGKKTIDLVLHGRDGHLVMTDDEGPVEMIRVGDFSTSKAPVSTGVRPEKRP